MTAIKKMCNVLVCHPLCVCVGVTDGMSGGGVPDWLKTAHNVLICKSVTKKFLEKIF
jgi:hypothetical protein